MLVAITSAIHMLTDRKRLFGLLAAGTLAIASCGGGSSSSGTTRSPSTVSGALSSGLIAAAVNGGIVAIDPATGKWTLVAPITTGAFSVSGPVWAPAPGLPYPVIYFAVHDDRPAETRTTSGVVPYDWLFRADPFTGMVEPLAASYDNTSEGPIGLVANDHYVAMTVGCCASYEVDMLDLSQPAAGVKVLAKPPTQAPFFTEGLAPGASGLIAVRAFGTGAWYWLNADAGVLNPFPLTLGQDDGPIAISKDGTLAAVSRPTKGPAIQAINVAIPVASPSTSPSTSAAATAAQSPLPSPKPSAAPRSVNSSLPHADGLAWSPDAKQLVLAVNGEIEIYNASAPDRTAPVMKVLSGASASGVDWSAPMPDRSLSMVRASTGPQPVVDTLLAATKLPAAADTPQERPLTNVYIWQYDSTRPSPIAAITDATPAILQQYPPLPAGVVFHHWAASGTWALLGGCNRYRVVITGSIAPTALTVGLASSTPCNAPSPSASSTAKASP
jgi:hypothetical protein